MTDWQEYEDAILEDTVMEQGEYLGHYGILHKSGRYPWNSGTTENKRNRDFLGYFDAIKAAAKAEGKNRVVVNTPFVDIRPLPPITPMEDESA